MKRTRDVLYYDGACGMCRRTARCLHALDWLHRLKVMDMTGVDDAALPVARERALEGIPMWTRDGRAVVGFPAVRQALLQTPLGVLPACVMYVPGVSHVCAGVYRHIAAHRRRNQACALPGEQR